METSGEYAGCVNGRAAKVRVERGASGNREYTIIDQHPAQATLRTGINLRLLILASQIRP